MALGSDSGQAQDRELAAGEPVLQCLEFVRLDPAVGDVRLHPVTFGECAGELAQAPDALGEHDHLLLCGDAGERLRGYPAQQGQAVAAAAHRVGDDTLADQRLGERRLRMRQRLGVDAGIDVHPDIAEHDPLGS